MIDFLILKWINTYTDRRLSYIDQPSDVSTIYIMYFKQSKYRNLNHPITVCKAFIQKAQANPSSISLPLLVN